MKHLYILLCLIFTAFGVSAQQVEIAFTDIGPDPNNSGYNLIQLNLRASTGYVFNNNNGGNIAGFNLRVNVGPSLTASSFTVVTTDPNWALGTSDWSPSIVSFNSAKNIGEIGVGWITVGTLRYPSSAVGTSMVPNGSNGNPPSFWADGASNAQPISIVSYTLPIKLTTFTATAVGSDAVLSWTTASEINNKGFEVQRGTDGSTFGDVRFVATKALNGNSSAPLTYTYNDPAVGNGTYYYRLKQVDLDGMPTLSDVRSVTFSGLSIGVNIAPNPVVASFNLSNAKVGGSYRIVGMSGQVVKAGNVTSPNTIVEATGLPAGVYVLQTQDAAANSVSLKFVKK